MSRAGQAGNTSASTTNLSASNNPAPMSVDAKLAAQAQAALSSASANTTRAASQSHQQQQQQQQQHHPNHHQQHRSSSTPNNTAPPARSAKKEEHLLLSLPSRDTGLHFVRPWDHGDEAGEYDEGIEDGDYSGHTNYPRLTNRGNKLTAGARSVRRGRLGGWDSYEAAAAAPAVSSPGLLDGSNNSTNSNGVNGSHGGTAKYGGPGSGAAPRKSAPPPHSTFEHNTLLYADDLRRHQLPSGLPAGKDVYPLTPNLTFVPSSSTAAARPDREPPAYSFLPGPNSPTSPSALSPRKRKKIYSAYTGLASTSGSTSNHTSAPVRAYLPVPPQNPIELVMSPLVTRTFSPRNNALEKLSLHATDLIERDMPLVRALTRVVDALRGNAVPGRDGTLGLPFSGDDEAVVQPEEDQQQETEQDKVEDKEKGENINATTTSADASMQVDGEDKGTEQVETTEEQPPKRRRTVSVEMQLDEEKAKKDVIEAIADPAVIVGDSVDTAVGAATVAAAEAAEDKAEEEALAPDAVGDASATAAADTGAPPSVAVPIQEQSKTADESTVDTDQKKTAEQAMASNEAVHDKVEEKEQVSKDVDMVAAANLDVRSAVNGASISRAGTPVSTVFATGEQNMTAEDNGDDNESNVGSMAQDDDEGNGAKRSTSKKRKAMTRVSSAVQRIANPIPSIHALLISPENVRVPIPPGAPGSASAAAANGAGHSAHPPYSWHDLLLPGGTPTIVTDEVQEPQASTSTPAVPASASAEGTASGSSKALATTSAAAAARPAVPDLEYRSLSSAEQEETVNLCIQELTKFLSDTLEYRDRLGEIRDSILGVEKRRKGVWTMARSYAHQLLWEEEQDRLAQGL